MRKTAVATLILMSLLASTAIYQQTVKAQQQGYIKINADGTITPSSAPIAQNGNTYTLTSDIKGEINILKSNITFNGNGHTIDQYAQSQNQGNAVGIGLSNVYNVTVANTTVINTGNGIYAIEQPTAGIYVDYGGSNVIIGNNVVNNYNAMSFLESNNNVITQNNFTNNNNPYVITPTAVMFWGSSNNKIYQNNFIDNNRPAGTASFDSQSSGNIWDNGKEGNYWDDYNGTDADGDGIGDTPYEVYTKNKGGALYPKNIDRYPLMQPFNSTLYLQKTTPPKISVLMPVNQVFNESSVLLLSTVNKPTSWMGYSFDGQDNVTITGNTTLLGLSNGLHNVTVYAEDTFGNIGSSDTIYFTVEVPEPFPTTLVAAAFIAIVAVVGVGLLVYFKKRKR